MKVLLMLMFKIKCVGSLYSSSVKYQFALIKTQRENKVEAIDLNYILKFLCPLLFLQHELK